MVAIVKEESYQIPFNVSARSPLQPVIFRVDGSLVSNKIRINEEYIAINDAR